MKNVLLHYQITYSPWGGGNSFLKAFKKYVDNHVTSFRLSSDLNAKYDLILVNGGHQAPGKYIDLSKLKKMSGRNLFSFKKIPIIYRLDGFRNVYGQEASEMDKIQFEVAQNFADFVIFQSEDSLQSAQTHGYSKNRYDIIHNGVDHSMFNLNGKKFWDKKSKLKILSCNWSQNLKKGYSTISLFSEIDNVEVQFVGNWPEDVPKRNVIVHKPLPQEELAAFYKNSDLFLHAAENDPCPNVVFEAMSSGLPILYCKSGGTQEIAKNYGSGFNANPAIEDLKQSLDEICKDYDSTIERLIQDHYSFSIDSVAEKYCHHIESYLNA